MGQDPIKISAAVVKIMLKKSKEPKKSEETRKGDIKRLAGRKNTTKIFYRYS